MVEKAELRPKIEQFQPVPKITISRIVAWCKENGLFEHLTDREQAVLTQHWLDGRSNREIAPEVGVTTKEGVGYIEKRAWGGKILQNPILTETQRAIISELLKNKQRDPDVKKRLGEKAGQNWQNPEFRRRMIQIRQEPEFRQKMSRIKRGELRNPKARRRMSKMAQKQWQNPVFRQRISQLKRERWQNPEYRERLTQMAREQWQSLELRQRVSEIRKKQWQNPVSRVMMLAALKIGRERKRADKIEVNLQSS